MNFCLKCDKEIDDHRYHLGYTECVECSDTEKYSAHQVYPHKTGGYIQVVSKEQSERLNKLDRRGVGLSKSAKHYKPFVVEKKEEPKRFSNRKCNKVYTSYDEALDKVSDYYVTEAICCCC